MDSIGNGFENGVCFSAVGDLLNFKSNQFPLSRKIETSTYWWNDDVCCLMHCTYDK